MPTEDELEEITNENIERERREAAVLHLELKKMDEAIKKQRRWEIMKTFQDYEKAVAEGRVIDFIVNVISEYRSSADYKIALDADEYEAERNTGIMQWIKYLYTMDGRKVPDFTSSNNRIASNFLHRLTTQRCAYSLGNGVSFTGATQEMVRGERITKDATKEALGKDFDTVLYDAAHYALLHKVSYVFWNLDHIDYFKMTEFVPLHDEYDGSLKAGFRFWSLDWNNKPVTVVVYEQDGYTKYRTKAGSSGLDLTLLEEKRAYKQDIAHNEVDPDEIVAESNYSYLPIIPLWGSKHKQSDLVGMKAKIDAYDLVKSGFANDLQDCAEIYWIVSNAMGENDETLKRFRDRIKLNHIAVVDEANSGVTPYTQDIPVTARESLLKSLRDQIYEDYGALDVHTVAAGATNDHIDAAYQPMDEEADDFEYQIIKCIDGILNLIGIEDVPIFNRNRVSNQKERTDMVMLAAQYLDDETIIRKLPFITPDEVDGILLRKEKELPRLTEIAPETQPPEEDDE